MKRILLSAIVAMGAVAMAGCEDDTDGVRIEGEVETPRNDGSLERVGEDLQRGAEDTGESIERGLDRTGDELERTGENIRDSVND